MTRFLHFPFPVFAPSPYLRSPLWPAVAGVVSPRSAPALRPLCARQHSACREAEMMTSTLKSHRCSEATRGASRARTNRNTRVLGLGQRVK